MQPFLSKANNNIPYGLQAALYNFVVNTEYSIPGPPVACFDELNCNSYLLPGSLSGSAPWPPKGWPQSPVVEIWNVPAVQYEFRNSIDNSEQFLRATAMSLGVAKYILAVQVCIAESRAYPGSLIAGKSSIKLPKKLWRLTQ